MPPPARQGKSLPDQGKRLGAARCRQMSAAMNQPFRPRDAAAGHDRSVRPARHLSARLGHRPLRLPLHLLHGRAHDLPAQEGPAVARGTGPRLLGVRRQGRAQASHHRRRAAGAQEHHVAVPRAGAPPRRRRPRRADADHQRQPAAEVRSGAEGCRRAPHQHLGRHAQSRPLQGHHALGRPRPGDGRRRRGRARPASPSSSTPWR